MSYDTVCHTLIHALWVPVFTLSPALTGFGVGRLAAAYCKAIPLQAWTAPEGSRRLRFPDFKQSAHEGGKVVSPTHRPPLPPGNIPGAHFC